MHKKGGMFFSLKKGRNPATNPCDNVGDLEDIMLNEVEPGTGDKPCLITLLCRIS